jgi:bifunctional ADP-heptose synthase (sugar kinase/adenylyltransferase)
MMIPMTNSKWDEFGKIMDTLSQEQRNAIAHNIRCYDYFLTFPDDAPNDLMEIVKHAAGVRP